MSLEANEPPQVIALELNDQQVRYLEELLATGLWGTSIEEVALRAIDQKLWEIVPELEAMS